MKDSFDIMKKVGEHVTIDFLGVKQDYSPVFYNKVIYKIAKKARVEVLNLSLIHI